MLINVKKQITEEATIELETPAYFKGTYGEIYKVDEEKYIRVTKDSASVWGNMGFLSDIAKIVAYEPATEAEFHNLFHTAIGNFEAFVSNAKAISEEFLID